MSHACPSSCKRTQQQRSILATSAGKSPRAAAAAVRIFLDFPSADHDKTLLMLPHSRARPVDLQQLLLRTTTAATTTHIL